MVLKLFNLLRRLKLTGEVDDDKPESFKLSSGNIGNNLGLTRTYYPFLIRHNGGYTVDTTPVVTFTDEYAHINHLRYYIDQRDKYVPLRWLGHVQRMNPNRLPKCLLYSWIPDTVTILCQSDSSNDRRPDENAQQAFHAPPR